MTGPVIPRGSRLGRWTLKLSILVPTILFGGTLALILMREVTRLRNKYFGPDYCRVAGDPFVCMAPVWALLFFIWTVGLGVQAASTFTDDREESKDAD